MNVAQLHTFKNIFLPTTIVFSLYIYYYIASKLTNVDLPLSFYGSTPLKSTADKF